MIIAVLKMSMLFSYKDRFAERASPFEVLNNEFFWKIQLCWPKKIWKYMQQRPGIVQSSI